jgi:hypothetical protein
MQNSGASGISFSFDTEPEDFMGPNLTHEAAPMPAPPSTNAELPGGTYVGTTAGFEYPPLDFNTPLDGATWSASNHHRSETAPASHVNNSFDEPTLPGWVFNTLNAGNSFLPNPEYAAMNPYSASGTVPGFQSPMLNNAGASHDFNAAAAPQYPPAHQNPFHNDATNAVDALALQNRVKELEDRHQVDMENMRDQHQVDMANMRDHLEEQGDRLQEQEDRRQEQEVEIANMRNEHRTSVARLDETNARLRKEITRKEKEIKTLNATEEDMEQAGGLTARALTEFQEIVRKLSYELLYLKGQVEKAKSGDSGSDDAPTSSSKQVGAKVKVNVYFYQGQRFDLLMTTPMSVQQFATARKASFRLNSLLKTHSKKSEKKIPSSNIKLKLKVQVLESETMFEMVELKEKELPGWVDKAKAKTQADQTYKILGAYFYRVSQAAEAEQELLIDWH